MRGRNTAARPAALEHEHSTPPAKLPVRPAGRLVVPALTQLTLFPVLPILRRPSRPTPQHLFLRYLEALGAAACLHVVVDRCQKIRFWTTGDRRYARHHARILVRERHLRELWIVPFESRHYEMAGHDLRKAVRIAVDEYEKRPVVVPLPLIWNRVPERPVALVLRDDAPGVTTLIYRDEHAVLYGLRDLARGEGYDQCLDLWVTKAREDGLAIEDHRPPPPAVPDSDVDEQASALRPWTLS